MVEPEDLANLCAIFNSLKTSTLQAPILKKNLFNSLRITSKASPQEIIDDSLKLNFVFLENDLYVLSKSGWELARAQKLCQPLLSKESKVVLIKRAFLNSGNVSPFREFFLRFEPDELLKTFIFRRSNDESFDDLCLIKVLDRVNLLDVEKDLILLNSDYLALFNEFLKTDRGISSNRENDQLNEAIGNLAEELAMQYEIIRLKKNDQTGLASYIQRISQIDQSAGYDITSFRGMGNTPENAIYIEVKGTTSPEIQFYWSRNERKVAKELGKEYWIYCYTNIDLVKKTGKGPFRFQNPIKKVSPPEFKVEPIDIFVQKNSEVKETL